MTFKTIVFSMKKLQRPLVAGPEMAHLPFHGMYWHFEPVDFTCKSWSPFAIVRLYFQ